VEEVVEEMVAGVQEVGQEEGELLEVDVEVSD
jgi:hypothetical protein